MKFSKFITGKYIGTNYMEKAKADIKISEDGENMTIITKDKECTFKLGNSLNGQNYFKHTNVFVNECISTGLFGENSHNVQTFTFNKKGFTRSVCLGFKFKLFGHYFLCDEKETHHWIRM